MLEKLGKRRLKAPFASVVFMDGRQPILEEVSAQSEVINSLPKLSDEQSKKITDVDKSQMNARITRLRAAELFLEACAIESSNDLKLPGIIIEHKLVVNYDGKTFVRTTASAEKKLSCILRSRITGGPTCPIRNLGDAERKALEAHVKLLNKSVAKRVAVIINPAYF